jgi:hypothetical protein
LHSSSAAQCRYFQQVATLCSEYSWLTMPAKASAITLNDPGGKQQEQDQTGDMCFMGLESHMHNFAC